MSMARLARDYDRHVDAATLGRKLTPAEMQAHARAALALRTAMMNQLDRDGYSLVAAGIGTMSAAGQ